MTRAPSTPRSSLRFCSCHPRTREVLTHNCRPTISCASTPLPYLPPAPTPNLHSPVLDRRRFEMPPPPTPSNGVSMSFRYNDTKRFPRLSFDNTPFARHHPAADNPASAFGASSSSGQTLAARPRRSKDALPCITETSLPLSWNHPAPRWPGFHNMGNTCYLNATLQCMFQLPIFSAMLESTAPPNSSSSTHFCAHNALDSIRSQMVGHRRRGGGGAIFPSVVTRRRFA